MNKHKLLKKILAGSKNVQFNDLTSLVEAFGFRLSRINGSHFIFVHPEIPKYQNSSTYKTTKERQAGPFAERRFVSERRNPPGFPDNVR